MASVMDYDEFKWVTYSDTVFKVALQYITITYAADKAVSSTKIHYE